MSYELTDFQSEVLDRSEHTPVLVDFWAPWCGPCKMLGPVIERLAQQANGRWVLVKLNTEEHPDLATQFEIRSIPCVKLFVHGQVVNQFLGALPESEIRRWLDQALPSPHAGVIKEARQRLAEGAFQEAAQLLEPVVNDAGTEEARVVLAQVWLYLDPRRVEALLSGVAADSPEADRAEALRVLARVLIEWEGQTQNPTVPLEQQFAAGLDALRRGDFGAALERLIEVVQRRKDFGQGTAREVCKAMFRLLGPRHPLSEKFHRSFSSALHA